MLTGPERQWAARHRLDLWGTVPTVVELLALMEAQEYESIRRLQGSMSYRSVRDPAAFERANYMKVLSSCALRARLVGGAMRDLATALETRALRSARRGIGHRAPEHVVRRRTTKRLDDGR